MKGKLPTWAPAQLHSDFVLEQKDCSKGLDMGGVDSSMDDEIMKEILEEEANKKSGDSARKNIKGSKKKKKGKKGKKGKKSSPKEEL